jgi:hypothetical protein
MQELSLSVANVLAVLMDRQARGALLEGLRREGGGGVPLRNRWSEVARRCAATAPQLRGAAFAVMQDEAPDDADLLLADLVFHPLMPDDILLHLLDRGLCLAELGHRAGPRALLERLAEQHGYSDAITTLALEHYGAEGTDPEAFLAFVTRHRHDPMLREALRRAAPTLPEDRRARALALLEAAAHAA